MRNPEIRPKILIVDDEESILSAARRLLRGRPLDVLTTTSPREALTLLSREDCWVVISDYRMPEMTGTQLLEEIKKQKPHVSRLMLTGFLELPIIEEAINKASVFRFITKPWDETELLLGIDMAVQHSERKRTNSRLAHEIGVQNQRLEQLTENLESEVVKRTRNIEESTKLAESKQRLVRDLTTFVKNLSRITNINELYECLFYELRKFSGVSAPYILLIESESNKGKLLWIESNMLHEKIFEALPKHMMSLRVRTSSVDDRAWWKSAFLSQTGKSETGYQLVAVPIRGRDSSGTHPAAVIFLEHNLDEHRLMEFLERLTERLQPVSVVLDKIILKEQLSLASRQWEATFDGFQDPIAIIDAHERVIRANKSFLEEDKNQNLLLQNDAGTDLVRTKTKVFRVHSYPVRQEETQAPVGRWINYFSDVTQERSLYLKLVQSEKLAAVGLLAGNIAHELNNPLSGIHALSQVVARELDETDSHRADIQEIEKAAVRCQQIIRNLLNFSEPAAKDHIETVDLNELVNLTIPLLKTALRHQNVKMLFDQHLPLVRVQPSEIQQVIFNLINNACQAMSQGGDLILRTYVEGRQAVFSVIDSGPGIPEEIRQRIFEPFFTTKSAGLGTGLGLSVSRSIVEKYGGELLLESEVGKGSTFTVRLPSDTIEKVS